ncbi:DUF262 domain-containing protein [Flavobacterium antarcticum]|uniref:DUF262 domain-containing protein n=1 Tax=Flavobacterium antarcticum TaxID=271155 RepID=UPI0003B67DF4|nr:DUF262 domain-containing protein [Flavobacterium antarcticum]
MEYYSLVTGEVCTLHKLFSKDNVVIIPDLQRDYCWGTITIDKNLVRDFVRNIRDNDKSDLSLGLIYGYEAPVGHIQLCDGQQRITTLFLLLGLINKKSNNAFQNQLISIFELEKDDKDPYLQYSIRESSLYFLSDLVCNFFIAKNHLKVVDIKSQTWYFKDYDLDPSIQSMISALTTIEEEINVVNILNFGERIINGLSFIYYDLGTRAAGEETFVVINTTGEPLTATENLKPLFIDAHDIENHEICSEKWEEWETWFWKNRIGSGEKKNDTADNGLREFLRWITLLTTKDKDCFIKIQETGYFEFDINLKYTDVDAYFKIVKYLFEDTTLFKTKLDWLAPSKNDKNGNSNNQIDWFRLLPVIAYIKRFGKENHRKVSRIKTFFKNLSRIENVSRAMGPSLPEAINLIYNMPTDDIAEIVKLTTVSNQILTDEEKTKFNLYLQHPEKRIEIENTFWKAEEHNILRGEIIALLNWATTDNTFDFYQFNEFFRVFGYLFHDTLKYSELDITRRALLTRNLDGFPRIFKGNTNTSFCWESSDWQTLIKDNEAKFGNFLKELIHASDMDIQLQKMILENDPNKEWDEFVKIPELLQFCHKKNIQWHSPKGWFLLSGKAMSGAYANLMSYRMYLDMRSAPFWDSTKWKLTYYDRDGTCSVFYNTEFNIVVDIVYCSNLQYKLEVFRRDISFEDTKNDLSSLSKSLNLFWNGERYVSDQIDKKDSIELIKRVQQFGFS